MFDYRKFKVLTDLLEKKAQFVPMDPAMAGGDPAAAGAPPPDPAAAGAPPMDPAAAGAPPMDPAMMGGDPAAAGAPPMDPAMMGAPPMDPAAMGLPAPDGSDVSPSGEPYMKITPTQLSKLFKQFAEVFKSVLGLQSEQPVQAAPAAPASDQALTQKMTELDAKIDALLRG